MSKYIINGTSYNLEKRNLLCEISISNPKLFIDLHSKTKRLYYPKGKTFVVQTTYDITGSIIETHLATKAEAQAIMNKCPQGINESVYKRYFGEPKTI